MNHLILLLFFLYGLIIGSFLNVVGLRVPKKLSIIKRPSSCPDCETVLSCKDLVPLLSYCWFRGSCRHCQHKIHPMYPMMECLTGLLFAFSYWKIGFQPELLIALFFISMFVIITVSDLRYMVIPNKVLWPFGVLFVVLRMVYPLTTFADALVGAIFGFLVLLVVSILTHGGIGGGDLKLFFVIGLVLGTTLTLLALFISSLIGLIISVFIIQVKKLNRKTPIPFGPSIAIASLIAYYFGPMIVERYMNLF